MKKLFLTSSRLDYLPEFIKGDPKKLKLIFIPTAANPYTDKWFAKSDRKKLIEFGFEINELDLKDQTPEKLEIALRDADIVYVTGGNSFYLLYWVNVSGFDKIIKKLIAGGVIYVGSSAGACIAGLNIEPIKAFDDSDGTPELKSFSALGLVDFNILPHYGKEKYKDKNAAAILESEKLGYKMIPLTDEQSIIVEDDNYKIIS